MLGTVEGGATLRVRLRDGNSGVPSFSLLVVPVHLIGIHAMIIRRGASEPTDIDKIDMMIKTANDIYAQVGMRFYIASISTTNLPSAYNIAPSAVTNDIGDVWRHRQLASLMPGVAGIKCYFVNRIVDENGRNKPTTGLTSELGMAITSISTPYTLSHEIGHLCGADDIYDCGGNPTTPLPGWVSHENCSEDWNGGCNGHGMPAARYYPTGMRMNAIVKRLLMDGVENVDEIGRDITIGNVHGYHNVNGSGMSSAQCEEGSIAVGFESGGVFRLPTCD